MAGRCGSWFTSTNFFVYTSHFLSSWGDRMWSFGVGLFLINISPESLQLTAVHGLCRGLSILLFGAFIGDIVDRTPRMKAAQVALVLQNFFVVVDAIIIFLYLVYRTDIGSWGQWTTHTAFALIITFSVLSRLTAMARSIAVEKDWIVEICGRDPERLATMTASLRRIDLTTSIAAPIATGLIMSSRGVEDGALLIGGWNLGSVFVEYYFLWRVYNTVPELKKKKNFIKAKADQIANVEMAALEDNLPADADDQVLPTVCVGGNDDDGKEEHSEEGQTKNENEETNATIEQQSMVDPPLSKECPPQPKSQCPKIFRSLDRLYIGWPIYAHYDVFYAGLALAGLYMTVLGFDSITVGYAKMQGISEGWLGVLMGLGSLFGIFGTFMYPVMRKHLGLPRTGIFGLSMLVGCLVPCVVSVWMPGSPFDLSLGFGSGRSHSQSSEANCTTEGNSLLTLNNSDTTGTSLNSQSGSRPSCPLTADDPDSNISVWMLLMGIVAARTGLWIADLAITQLFLEVVQEEERGKVNGVQSSLNQLMDLLKFLLVILLPYEHQFGLTILISFIFISLSWLLYAVYLRKVRGHFFHLNKCVSYKSRPRVAAEEALET